MTVKELIKRDCVYLSRIQLYQNPRGWERLQTVTENLFPDTVTEGVWIKKHSTAHSLALILNFEPYDETTFKDGTYTRDGKIA